MSQNNQHLDLAKSPITQSIFKQLMALSPSEQERAVKAIHNLIKGQKLEGKA